MRGGDIKLAGRLKRNFGSQLREIAQRKNRIPRRSRDRNGRGGGEGKVKQRRVCETAVISVSVSRQALFIQIAPRSMVDQRVSISRRLGLRLIRPPRLSLRSLFIFCGFGF